ncbi:energy-coupling factor ABC transporter ATP-binding protein [Pseudoclavibacter sp. CFCC 14310]|uniref:ABC transporter ATP-binding protein n=1 Tax=Pseudoclavibacter sp. CFCC 14310 TaxID=2615180 RepID=UPI0013016F59|nr:energy-coupling factor ABC transporter ATP-binding protein [Pseudoclavibacter sp. CFCC 14310]KAB1647348.1 energy-coupling factor ABC transporter ATP-binding protein [Pseudoclavibacter sp. CFCC 14310]
MIRVEDVRFSYAQGHADASPYGPALDADAISKTPAVLVLDDLSFEVPAGTLTVLCGASGSGKSSALRLLNGLVPNFHHGDLTGVVEVAGINVPATDLLEAGRTTATVFQNPRTQFFTADVRSELAFRDENYGLDPAEIQRRSVAAARQVGIENLLDRGLRQLSGGELQKVACAQAIAAGTSVLLFDEPTSNLSPAAIAEFAQLLGRLKAQGHAIVVAEHRLYFLRDLADQVLQLDHGRVHDRWSGDEFRALSESSAAALGLRTLRAPAALAALLVAEHADAVVADHAGSGSSRLADERGELAREIVGRSNRAQEPREAGASTPEHGLVLDAVRFRYGRHDVLDIPHLEFPRGQISVIVGANGVGKSTLARVICGLAAEDRGSGIRLDGRRVSPKMRMARSGMVMQDVHRQLFCDSVADEVRLGLDSQARDEVDIDALLQRFDLAELADRHPLSLSGGQKQRVVIAAALAKQPQVCVFDEPTSGVDRRHLRAIAECLRELAEAGTVVIVITHDPELIDACADRLVAIGRLGDEHPSGQSIHITELSRNRSDHAD